MDSAALECESCGATCRSTHLCHKCESRIRRAIDQLQTAWMTARPPDRSGGSGAGGGSARSLPGGTEWVNFRQGADIARCLRHWEDALVQTFNVPGPSSREPRARIQWLRSNLKHLGRGGLGARLRPLENELYAVVRMAKKATKEGRPEQQADCQTPGCDWVLTVNAAEPDRSIECPRCRTSWTYARLVAVGLALSLIHI